MELLAAARATGGTARKGNPWFAGVSTDTRSIAADELFVALRGPKFDGHDFIQAAVERGAVAIMVDEAWAVGHASDVPQVVVRDTRLALGALAAYWRSRFELPLIGITGSNGKTTVKEMTAAILRAQARADGYDPELAVLATLGNLNNDIGVPLMLLGLHITNRAAVIEMGMNHPGEIAYLTQLARPTVALVNNAQRAHLEGVGSVAEVAREKGAIYAGLDEGGVAIVNADDAFCDYWRNLNSGRRVVSFGLAPGADVSAEVTRSGSGSALRVRTHQGSVDVALPAPGMHNVCNALAATAAATAVGTSLAAVAAGLSAYAGVKGRLQLRHIAGGATLIDDSYNANPDSMRAAIDVLTATPGRTILVLGDMGELGERAGQLHDEIGGYAKSQGVDLLLALGELAELAVRNFGSGGRHFGSVDTLVAALRAELDGSTTVLVKGSRFMRMERVVEALAES
jgi:UDP-N-acetylmuramoyl-tripeptide--D-alanyl-D-alanine ligase